MISNYLQEIIFLFLYPFRHIKLVKKPLKLLIGSKQTSSKKNQENHHKKTRHQSNLQPKLKTKVRPRNGRVIRKVHRDKDLHNPKRRIKKSIGKAVNKSLKLSPKKRL